jgi:hypothetical protein
MKKYMMKRNKTKMIVMMSLLKARKIRNIRRKIKRRNLIIRKRAKRIKRRPKTAVHQMMILSDYFFFIKNSDFIKLYN